VGEEVAMFEAIHGSAPDIAGMDIANPSGLLNGAIMMLVHIGQPEIAERISNAWMKTLEDGIHTGDIFQPSLSSKKVGTREFAKAVIERLGQVPTSLIPAVFDKSATAPMQIKLSPVTKSKKELIGVDVFVDWDTDGRNPDVIGEILRKADADGLVLQLITNRGIKVFPGGMKETFCTDHWRCRFQTAGQSVITHKQVLDLLSQVEALGFDFIKTEHLYAFDGVRAYSLAQGE
jgi:isocitrate dehydrogenase